MALAWALSRYFIYQHPIWMSDVGGYEHKANLIAQGLFPYSSEVGLEYPPLVIPLFRILHGVASALSLEFHFVYRQLAWVVDALCFVLLMLFPVTDTRKKAASLLLYLFITTCMMHLLYERLDIGVALIGLLAATALWKRRTFGAGFWVGVGSFFKFNLVVLLPLTALPWQSPRKAMLAWTPFVVLALGIQIYLSSNEASWSFLSYHAQRGIQIESLWASLLAVIDGLPALQVVNNYGAQHLISPSSEWVLSLSKIALPLICLGTLIQVQLRLKKPDLTEDEIRSEILRAVLVMSLAFLIFNRVFSPQYWVGIAPLIALQPYRKDLNLRDHLALAALLLAALITALLFSNYWDIVKMNPASWRVLNLRNGLVLGALVALMVGNPRTNRRSESGSPVFH